VANYATKGSGKKVSVYLRHLVGSYEQVQNKTTIVHNNSGGAKRTGQQQTPKTTARGLPPPRSPPQLPPRPSCWHYHWFRTSQVPTSRRAPRAALSLPRLGLTSPTLLGLLLRGPWDQPVTHPPSARFFISQSRSSRRRYEDVTLPEPVTLAQRIQNSAQHLVGFSSSHYHPFCDRYDYFIREAADPATPDGSIPPGPVPIIDSRILSFLRNENRAVPLARVTEKKKGGTGTHCVFFDKVGLSKRGRKRRYEGEVGETKGKKNLDVIPTCVPKLFRRETFGG
jgi:hypothetical protein